MLKYNENPEPSGLKQNENPDSSGNAQSRNAMIPFLFLFFFLFNFFNGNFPIFSQEGDAPLKAFKWYYCPRAFPFDTIPGGAYENAIIQREALRQSNGYQFPLASQWEDIGPKPMLGEISIENWAGRIYQVVYDAKDPLDPNREGKVIYITGATGGLWKTEDGGVTWLNKSGNLPTLSAGAFTINYVNNNKILYWGSGDGTYYFGDSRNMRIFKSTDDGATWTSISSGIVPGTAIYKIVVSPNDVTGNTIFAATFHGLYKTTNGGGSWTRIIPDPNSTKLVCTDVCFSPDGTWVYAVGPSDAHSYPWDFLYDGIGFWRSDDGGNNFAPVLQQSSNFPHGSNVINERTLCAVSKASGAEEYVWFITFDNLDFNVDVYKSTNHGQNFTSRVVGDNQVTRFQLVLRPSDVNKDTCFAGSQSLYLTTNGGATSNDWTCISGYCGSVTHADFLSLDFNPFYPQKIVTGNDGGVFRSDNLGTSWSSCNQNLGSLTLLWSAASSTYNSNFVAGGLQDFGYGYNYTTSPGSTSWHSVDYGADGGNMTASPFKSNHFVANKTYDQSVDYSNNGLIFNDAYGYGSSSTTSVEHAPFTQHPTEPGVVYTARFNSWDDPQQVYFRKSTDYGANWGGNLTPFREFQRPNDWDKTAPYFIAISPSNPNTIIMDFSNQNEFWLNTYNAKSRLIKSINGGQTWEGIDFNPPIAEGGQHGLPNRSFTDVEFDPKNSDLLYLTVSGYYDPNSINEGHVFKSTDGGYNWTNISGSLPDIPVNDLIIHYTGTGSSDKELIIATDAGIYVSNAENISWRELAADFPNSPAIHMDYNRLSGKLRANTWGRGAWEVQLDGTTESPGPVYVQDRLYITDNVILTAPIVVAAGGKLILGHEDMPDGFSVTFDNDSKITVESGGEIECPANYYINLTSTTSWDGIEIKDNGFGTIRKCVFTNTETPITVTSTTESGNDIVIDSCIFYEGSIISSGRDNVFIIHNTVNSPSAATGTAINIIWGNNVAVSKNLIRNSNVGIEISNTYAMIQKNIIEHDALFSVSTGISADNCYTNDFKNNVITDYPIGIYLYNSSPVMFENTITGVSQSSTALYAEYNSSPRLRPLDNLGTVIWDAGKDTLDVINNYNDNNAVFIHSNSIPDLDGGCNLINSSVYSINGDIENCFSGYYYIYARNNTWNSFTENVCDADYYITPTGCGDGEGGGNPGDESTEPPPPIIINYGHGIYDTIKITNRNFPVSADNLLYSQAMQDELNNNYTQAETKYKQIIELYQDSVTASNSLKRLIYCYEKMNADIQQFSALRSYYQSLVQANPTDTGFVNIAEELASKCLVKRGDLPDAITEYENVVQNSADSLKVLCAELNIIETYMIMEQGPMAKSFTGRYQALKPVSVPDGIRLINEKLHRINNIKKNNQLPTTFSLSQNYPNPFNPVTKINYALPNKSNVTIKVFDLLGRQIKTLVNEFKEAGYYTVSFDGSGLASGVYFYTIEAGNFKDSKKMVLIK